ncbi:amidohydrolase family protein [Sphingomonas sp. LHG3406-1]|uniref:metal-dependent hydrolase family protein n=1 Tax=Sphingomonas sp. LHG3406-1 TaxID=2804617 RepID=UPI002629E104|nr:amidohydrolase family protein [Sphingomonas sp. LHG3406-1]
MIIAILAAAFAQAAPAPLSVTVIHAGTLIDVPGQQPKRNASIVVRGRQILEVRDGFVDVPGARVVDLRTSTVMPGFIDSHVHVGGLDDPLRARVEAASRDLEDEAFTAFGNSRRLLMAGFTTVRDLNGNPRQLRALRDAIGRGDLVGPTILYAGRTVGITMGHGSGQPGLNRALTEDAMEPERASGRCDGVESCRRAVRYQIGMGADVIKIAASGGVLSDVAGGLGKQMTDDEMKAVVDTAASFGRRVAAHAHGVQAVNDALKAGVASIEHGTFTNEESFRLYRQTGAYYVPTLLAPMYALKSAERGALRPNQVAKAREAAGNAEKSFAEAVRRGVKIAFGTDSGVSPHGTNAEEFVLMTRNGMSAMDAIKAATVNAADLLGRSSTIGTIEAGKDADIVAVEGDPLADIGRLQQLGFVMKWGQVVKQGGQRQLTAAD